jgi:hypothetical protein
MTFEEILNLSTDEIRKLYDQTMAASTKKNKVDRYWLLGFLNGVLTERTKSLLAEKWPSGKPKYLICGPTQRSNKCEVCEEEFKDRVDAIVDRIE